MEDSNTSDKAPSAFLVDLVSNRKIPISVPRCKAGRDELNDVVITGDQSISRFHFVISQEGGQYYVQDSKSRHGTYLNGNQLTETEPLKDGDVLKVGVSLFWFVIDSPTNTGSTPTLPVNAETGKTDSISVSKSVVANAKSGAQAAAARTSDNMPAMSNDSLLAARKTGGFNADGTPRQVGPGLSRLLSQQSAEEEDEEIAEKPSTIQEKSEVVEAKDEVEPPVQPDKEPSPATAEKDSSDEDLPAQENEHVTAPEADEKNSEHPSTSTLELFAEVIGEAANDSEEAPASKDAPVAEANERKDVVQGTSASSPQPAESKLAGSATNSISDDSTQVAGNGAKDAMNMVKDTIPHTVPDWCNSYLATELRTLGRELADLNEQVRQYQQKVQEVEDRIAVTKSLRNALLTTQGDELVGACIRVLTYLGWHVKPSAEDKQELQLLIDDKVCIARIVWTNNTPERSHLGQLTISQTRFWCEQGSEPKGILIVSRVGDQPLPPLAPDYNSELSDYAGKKNVCLMTTLQLLSLYRDAVLKNASVDSLRSEILSSNGWLPGFSLDASTEGGDKPEPGTNKLSSLLSG